MLYTILPLEEIFPEDEAATKIITVDGIGVEVEEVKTWLGRIRRLICTDPQAYLDPRLQPGVEIRF